MSLRCNRRAGRWTTAVECRGGGRAHASGRWNHALPCPALGFRRPCIFAGQSVGRSGATGQGLFAADKYSFTHSILLVMAHRDVATIRKRLLLHHLPRARHPASHTLHSDATSLSSRACAQRVLARQARLQSSNIGAGCPCRGGDGSVRGLRPACHGRCASVHYSTVQYSIGSTVRAGREAADRPRCAVYGGKGRPGDRRHRGDSRRPGGDEALH